MTAAPDSGHLDEIVFGPPSHEAVLHEHAHPAGAVPAGMLHYHAHYHPVGEISAMEHNHRHGHLVTETGPEPAA